MSVTLCNSTLGPATDKLHTVIERVQIAHEDLRINNPLCRQLDTYGVQVLKMLLKSTIINIVLKSKALRMKLLSCNIEDKIKFT